MATSERALLLTLGLAFSGCVPFTAVAPEGFAAYEDRAPFRALSPDGVLYRVRAVENEPEARLPFWQEALKKRMVDAGYQFIREGETQAGSSKGYLLELAAPVGTEDHTYLLALFDAGDELVLVEASGEVTEFEKRREAVMKAIGGLQL